MLKVGLTGGLASGKSFAAFEFERLGCKVMQADKLAHRIMAEDEEARREIIEAFGAGIIDENDAVDRKKLGSIVFADPIKLTLLNSIIHPRVLQFQQQFFAQLQCQQSHAIAMIEAAIMIETESYKHYDCLVLTVCSREQQIERFIQREGTSRQDAESRLARQLPLEEKKVFADYLIDTSGSKQKALHAVRQVYTELRAEADKAQ